MPWNSKQPDLKNNPAYLEPRVTAVESSLAQKAQQSDLQDIAVSVKSYGAKGDGVTDDTVAIQNTLNSNQNVFIPKGNYIISNTIIVPVDAELTFAKGASLTMTNLTKHALQVRDKTKIKNATITLNEGHTGAAIYLNGVDGIHYHVFIEDTIINAGGSQSKGILLESIANGSAVTNVSVINAYISHCDKAIHLIQDNATTGYVTGCVFTDIYTYQCAYHFYLQGNVIANTFQDFSCQWTSSVIATVYGAYCEGRENVFNGRFWDFKNGALAYYFSIASQFNLVETNMYLPSTLYSDLGLYNKNMQLFNDQRDHKIYVSNTSGQSFFMGSTYYYTPVTYVGNQDDALAYSDKRYTVSNLGMAIAGGGFDKLFNPHTGLNYGVTYTNPTSASPAIIEINMGSNPLLNVPLVGLTFSQQYFPSDFMIEYVGTNGGSYTTLVSVIGNTKTSYVALFGTGDITTNIYKLKITITKVYSTSSNASNTINLQRIFAPSAIQQGMTYLPRGGGLMYGDLDLNKYKAKNMVLDQGATASRPTGPVVGQVFYDTTLGKPIYCKVGGSSPTWTDASGTIV